MVRKQNDNTIKEVIERLIKSYGWDTKLDQVDVYASWERVVGGVFAKHTTKLTLNNRVLYVKLDSSVIRNELHMSRNKIKELLNQDLGKKVIDEIVLR